MRIKLTKSALERIPAPAEGRLTVHDTATPGLCVRITANDARLFYLCRWRAGKVNWIRLGAVGEMSVDEAQRMARNANADLSAGVNPNAVKRKERDGAKLADLWRHYLTVAKVKERTLTDYQNNFNRYLAPWSGRRLTDISRDDVRRLHTRIAECKIDRESTTGGRKIQGGPTAANRTIALLSILFNAGADEFKTTANPARGVKRAKESARERYLSEAELPAFLQVVDSLKEQASKDFIRIALFTGQRRANLQAMAWEDISLPFATWTIERGEMKGGHGHVVPLVGPVMEILKRRREKDPDGTWVFPTESKTGHIQEPKKAITTAAEKAGIAALSVHDLRRTCATWLNATGASEGTIAKLLAHKRQSVTGAVYIKTSLDTVRLALAKAVDAMELAAGIVKAPAAAAG